jgi:hypothetical protein
MAAGIHVYPTTHGAGYAHEDVQAGKSGFRGTARREGSGEPCPNAPGLLVLFHPIEAFPHPDHQRIQAFVRQQDIRSQPDSKPGYAGIGSELECGANIFSRLGQDDRGGSADPIGGVAAGWFGLPNGPGDTTP